MEIPNINELAKVIERAEPGRGHKRLLTAIQQRYPASEFRLVGTGRKAFATAGIVSANGQERIADSHKTWLTAAFNRAGGSAHKVYEKYKDCGYLFTERRVICLRIAMPFGREADAFIQIEVDAIHEIASRPLFDTDWCPPRNLQELLNPLSAGIKNTMELTPWHYQLANVTDIRRFIFKMKEVERNRLASIPELQKRVVQDINYGDVPTTKEMKSYHDTPFGTPEDWLNAPRRESRLMADWNASSAGKDGHRLCDHWALELYDDKADDGTRYLGYMPRLSDRGTKLPVIVSSKGGSYRLLVEKLNRFNEVAGYPMAWYFHMLHGGKVDRGVGNRVMNCLQEGEINLPPHDLEIVLKWYQWPYGF